MEVFIIEGKIRVGVIGCGEIGKEHINRMTNIIRGTEVTAVADFIPETAKRVAEQYGAQYMETGEELIASELVDAVVVASSDESHMGYVLECIKHRKYVFCEKPLAETAADCEQLLEAERNCGKRFLQVGFMRRYDQGYRQLKEIISRNELGEPLIIHAAHRNALKPPTFDTDRAITRCAIHEIDILRWLLNEECETAQVLDVKQSSATMGDYLNPQIVMLKTYSGQRIDIEIQTDGAYAYDIQCQVVCEHGVVNLPDPTTVLIREKAQRVCKLFTSWADRFMDAYNVQMQEWANGVMEGKVTGPSAWDGYAACAVADATIRSRKTGCPEKVCMIKKPEIY